MNRRKLSIAALLALVPAPALGTATAMVWMPGHPLGRAVFAASKVWLLLFPVLWVVVVDGSQLRLPRRPRGSSCTVGAAAGLALAAVIVAAYLLFGRVWIAPGMFREAGARLGLDRPRVFLAGAVYWVVVNSLLEEYVWRWFVFRRWEEIAGSGFAVPAAAACFTLHHVVALSVYLAPALNAVASAGVFIGGVVWSLCYLRYRSIWPGYVSHAMVDAAVFAIGYRLIFL